MILRTLSLVSLSLLAVLPALAADDTKKVVKELQPTIATLKNAECPVYLPTWIPEGNKAKFSQALLNNDSRYPHGFEVSLGGNEPIANCDLTFYVLGGEGRSKGKHPVKLSSGRTGFLKNALIEWNQGKYKYGLGFINSKTTNADMIKCANSVIQVPSKKKQ
jgi:hypothetical protein